MPVSCPLNLLDVSQDCQYTDSRREEQGFKSFCDTSAEPQENEYNYDHIAKKSWRFYLQDKQNKTNAKELNKIFKAHIHRETGLVRTGRVALRWCSPGLSGEAIRKSQFHNSRLLIGPSFVKAHYPETTTYTPVVNKKIS